MEVIDHAKTPFTAPAYAAAKALPQLSAKASEFIPWMKRRGFRFAGLSGLFDSLSDKRAL